MNQVDGIETTAKEGTCYCGAVKVCLSGAPAFSGYCHCKSCRKWHAAPVAVFNIWPDTAISIEGETTVSTVSDESHRISCAKCGGAIANKKPNLAMTALYPIVCHQINVDNSPRFHLFYAERVVDFADGLPKYSDQPTDFGGSGEMAVEPDTTGWRTLPE